jgi:hypothetical protein
MKPSFVIIFFICLSSCSHLRDFGDKKPIISDRVYEFINNVNFPCGDKLNYLPSLKDTSESELASDLRMANKDLERSKHYLYMFTIEDRNYMFSQVDSARGKIWDEKKLKNIQLVNSKFAEEDDVIGFFSLPLFSLDGKKCLVYAGCMAAYEEMRLYVLINGIWKMEKSWGIWIM